jgi:hypothetical protein
MEGGYFLGLRAMLLLRGFAFIHYQKFECIVIKEGAIGIPHPNNTL